MVRIMNRPPYFNIFSVSVQPDEADTATNGIEEGAAVPRDAQSPMTAAIAAALICPLLLRATGTAIEVKT